MLGGHAKSWKKMCRNWKTRVLSRKVTIPKFKKCDNVPRSRNPKIYEVWQCPEKSQSRNLRNETTFQKVQSQNIRNKTISGSITRPKWTYRDTMYFKIQKKDFRNLVKFLTHQLLHIILIHYNSHHKKERKYIGLATKFPPFFLILTFRMSLNVFGIMF